MTFIDDNGNQLNFDGEFAITKRSVSLFDGKIQGDTSINFSIDNNSVNRKTLGYYGPQMINQVAATKHAFNRVRNGNIIDRGYIVIQDEYEDILDCYYVSGNSNWIQILNTYITDLDYTGILSLRNYITQMNDTSFAASTGRTYGTVFPIIDCWSNYQRGLSIYGTTSIVYGNANLFTTSISIYTNPIFDFYPCFYVSSLIDEFSAQLGIKINGTLLQDKLFKTLIIPASNGIIKRSNLFSPIILHGSAQVMGAGTNKYTSYTELSDNNNLFVSSRFTCDRVSFVKSTINIISNTSGGITFIVAKNGANTTPLTSVTTSYTYTFFHPMLYGDFLEIFIVGATTINLNWTIEELDFITYDNYVLPSDYLPKVKCIDVIKMLINTFGCSSYFDDFSKTLSLNIIENYKLEDAQDWSNYYLSHRSEYTVNTSKHNYINTKSNTLDDKIRAYNNINAIQYGSGDIVTDNTLTENNVAIHLPFSASYFDRQFDNSYTSRVPLIEFTDADRIPFLSISSGANGLCTFNITGGGGTVTNGDIFRIINSSGIDFGLFKSINNGSSSILAAAYFPYYGNDTGWIVSQSIKFNNIGFCLLSNSTINAWDLYPGYSTIGWVDPISSVDNRRSISDYAFFTKYKSGLGIDQFKNNLSIDNPQLNGYNDPSIKERFLNKVTRFFENPPIRMMMILPEAIYQSFKFDKFIYVKSKKLTGYFYVDSIVNYIDGNTPVEVNFYML